METINIICVDDQQEVLDSVLRDLRPLTSHIRLEEASCVSECLELLDHLYAQGEHVAVVFTDQVMPDASGTDLMAKIAADRRFSKTRKVLLTGQASHADTINAINHGHLDNYVEKPWKPELLLTTAKRLLTHYILDSDLEYKDYMPVLDQATLIARLH